MGKYDKYHIMEKNNTVKMDVAQYATNYSRSQHQSNIFLLLEAFFESILRSSSEKISHSSINSEHSEQLLRPKLIRLENMINKYN